MMLKKKTQKELGYNGNSIILSFTYTTSNGKIEQYRATDMTGMKFRHRGEDREKKDVTLEDVLAWKDNIDIVEVTDSTDLSFLVKAGSVNKGTRVKRIYFEFKDGKINMIQSGTKA